MTSHLRQPITRKPAPRAGQPDRWEATASCSCGWSDVVHGPGQAKTVAWAKQALTTHRSMARGTSAIETHL